jgi:GcrA cell cycle regulator
MTLTEQTNTTWDDERIETLRALWTDGQSARQIAEVLGCTRNAIIGKSNRLGLSRSHNPSSEPKKSRDLKANNQTRAAQPVEVRAPTQSAPPIYKHVAGNKTILELDLRDCRWPLGNEEPARFFCGAKALPDKPYCGKHYRISSGVRIRGS